MNAKNGNVLLVPDQYNTVQAAIQAANDHDVIKVKSGTYCGNVVIAKPITLIGLHEPEKVEKHWPNKSVILRNTEIDKYVEKHSVLVIKDTQNVVIENIEFFKGHAEKGGNCFIENAGVVFRNCNFKFGTAIYGAAIYAKNSDTFFDNCNTWGAETKKGTAYIENGTAVFDKCVFDYTQAVKQAGIAQTNRACVTITGCEFTENEYTIQQPVSLEKIYKHINNFENFDHLGQSVINDILYCIETGDIDALKTRAHESNVMNGNDNVKYVVWDKVIYKNSVIATAYNVGELGDEDYFPSSVLVVNINK